MNLRNISQRIAFALVAIILFHRSCDAADVLEAIVRIETRQRNGSPSVGTGFFIDSKPIVVTAYHVIEGSLNIELVDSRRRKFTSNNGEVLVRMVSGRCDLAILELIPNSQYTTPHHLSFSTTKASQMRRADDLIGYGHPQGIRNQAFRGSPTQDGFLKSGSLNDANGKPLCELEDVDLIPIDMTIGNGMSGGPLVKDGSVVGVLSGSLAESNGVSRTIAWAMPITLLTGEETEGFSDLNAAPEDVANWPKLKLLSKNTKKLSVQIVAPRESPAKPKIKWILQVNNKNDRRSSWKTVGEFSSEAEANLASLPYEDRGYATFLAVSDGVKTTLPPIINKN